jgi:hypothetical protein
MNTVDRKLKHLEWAIQSRAKNQVCSLRLLTLFENHSDTWKTKKFSTAAQDLIGISFSLWRSAFLADKTGKRVEVFSHGKMFLEKIIEDNAISYPQDKNSKEWTFNYYTRSARSALENLHGDWKDIVPAYQRKTRNATERWEHCQALLDQAITGFEKTLKDQKAQKDQTQEIRAARKGRRQRRAKVRQMTLAGRGQ